jgi:hypothetical protein
MFQPTFLKKKSEAYEITILPVCTRPYLLIPQLQPYQKADVQTSEVDAKLERFNAEP